MNGLNGVEHQFDHFKTTNEEDSNDSYTRNQETKNLLPPIANLNINRPSSSIKNYLNSDYFHTSNDVPGTSTALLNGYQHISAFQYSQLPSIQNYSQNFYSNNSYFPHQMNDSSGVQYNYPSLSYGNTVPNKFWPDSYQNNGARFQMRQFIENGSLLKPEQFPHFKSSSSYINDTSLVTSTLKDDNYILTHNNITSTTLIPNKSWNYSYQENNVGSQDSNLVSNIPMVKWEQHSPSQSSTSYAYDSTPNKLAIKDAKYILRRQKNNIAAKKCRDNKKQKSNELSHLVVNYERENEDLRQEIDSLKMTIADVKNQMSREN